MSDDELRAVAKDYAEMTDDGEYYLTAPARDAGRLAKRLLELLPPAAGRRRGAGHGRMADGVRVHGV